MGKRKRSKSRDSDYESIRKKVKKLQHKLKKIRRRTPSTSSIESVHDSPSPFYESDIQDEDIENLTALEAEDISTHPLTTEQPTVIPPVEEVEPATLDPEILQILGDDPADLKTHGDDLHKDIAPRWMHILTNGLSKETKSELLKVYLPSENCVNMKAPKLNLEIKAALSEINLKKDLYSQSKQNQIASCLAAVGKVLNWALSSKDTVPQAQEIIKPISDAGRLLCDCHYRESQSRRFAIINTLNKQTRDTIKNTKIDEYLFGSSLAEHLKSSKAISKSGSEMKALPTPRAPFRQPPTTQPQRGALNSRGTSRAAAGEPRQFPASRRPAGAAAAAAAGSRRYDSAAGARRTSSYSRQRTRRR